MREFLRGEEQEQRQLERMSRRSGGAKRKLEPEVWAPKLEEWEKKEDSEQQV